MTLSWLVPGGMEQSYLLQSPNLVGLVLSVFAELLTKISDSSKHIKMKEDLPQPKHALMLLSTSAVFI